MYENKKENKHGAAKSRRPLTAVRREPMKTTDCARRRQSPGNVNNSDSHVTHVNNVNDHNNIDTMNDGNNHLFGAAFAALNNHGGPGQQIHFPGPVTDVAEQVVETLALRPHNQHVLMCLKASGLMLVFSYFVLPLLIRFNPWIMRELTFLNRVSWPPYVNLSNPDNYGLHGARSFHLDMASGISLGVWHVLPTELVKTPSGDNEQTFMQLLSCSRKVILYLHGNAGSRAGWHRVQLYKVLASLGFHVITFDYRGYGDSSGSPTEDGMCEDAILMYKWLRQNGVSEIYIWGHSLGSGVAVKVTKMLSEAGIAPKGLVLESAFNNIIEAVYYYPFARPFVMMPWFSWAVIESIKQNNISFTSDLTISSIPVPILMLHAKDDTTIPYILGQKLYVTAMLSKRKASLKFVSFDDIHGYGHKHIHKAPELPGVIREFMATIDEDVV